MSMTHVRWSPFHLPTFETFLINNYIYVLCGAVIRLDIFKKLKGHEFKSLNLCFLSFLQGSIKKKESNGKESSQN